MDAKYRWEPPSEEWRLYAKIRDILAVLSMATTVFSGSTYPTTNEFFFENYEGDHRANMDATHKEVASENMDPSSNLMAISTQFHSFMKATAKRTSKSDLIAYLDEPALTDRSYCILGCVAHPSSHANPTTTTSFPSRFIYLFI